MPEDRKAIACNVSEGTNSTSPGCLAYVLDANQGNGHERLRLLIRSRSGRWIEKWQPLKRLSNFRLKTIPPSHPQYERLEFAPDNCLQTILAAVK